MKPGSVIVDLAGETGGNCELTEPGQTVVKHNVTIVSPLNLPATMPEHASALYARNLQALIELLADDESGASRRTSRTRSSPAPASSSNGEVPCSHARHEPVDPGAGRLRRLRGDLQGPQHAAHAADVGHERDPRHRDARRHPDPGRRRAPTASSTSCCWSSRSPSARSTSSAASWSPTGCSRCSRPSPRSSSRPDARRTAKA